MIMPTTTLILLLVIEMEKKDEKKVEEKIAYRRHCYDDQGGGSSFCTNCGHNFGWNFTLYEKCPDCNYKLIETGITHPDFDRISEDNPKRNKITNISELVETIESKRGAEVRMHPYGFLQLSLSEGAWRDSGYRLHVWSDDLPQMKRPEFQVHDHVYGVRSKVLLGELRDISYIVKEDNKGEYLFFEATAGGLRNTGVKVSCMKRRVLYLSAGDQYSVIKGDFHSSDSLAPLTATLFQKLDADLSMSPSVIGPAYYEKKELLSDDRTFDQRLAWKVIDKTLEEIKRKTEID